jgi:APA family basic amino acid/polyamine antiporter
MGAAAEPHQIGAADEPHQMGAADEPHQIGAADEPPRQMSALDAAAVIVGIVIGSGIFLVPAQHARALKAPVLILAVWLLGGVLSLLGGLAYAELGARRPLAGGQYVYLRDAYGPRVGFLYSWVLFLVIQTGSIAAVAMGFAQYLGFFLALSPGAVKTVAVGAILALSALNSASVRSGVALQNLFCALKLLALAALILVGLSSSQANFKSLSMSAPTLDLPLLSTFGLALVGVLWAFDGWNCVSFVSGQVREPGRSLPLALLAGLSVVTLVYLLANLTYLAVLGAEGMASAPNDRVASTAAQSFAGDWGARGIAAGILVSTFGCLNGMIMSSPWVYYAVAKDGLFFSIFARTHALRGTPQAAIWAQGLWSGALALSGTYDQLFTYVVFVSWVFYAMAVASIYVFRLREGAPPPGHYRTWGYPWTPALFILAALGLLANTLHTAPVPAVLGLLITAAGIPVHAVFARTRRASDQVPTL